MFNEKQVYVPKDLDKKRPFVAEGDGQIIVAITAFLAVLAGAVFAGIELSQPPQN